MNKITVLFIIFISSCATQPKTVGLGENWLVVEDGIEIQKAKEIVIEFLAQEKKFHIKGKIYISNFEYKYQKQCQEYPEALATFKDFCNARYFISHSSDPYCIGSARVIESCQTGECKYKFNEYVETCE